MANTETFTFEYMHNILSSSQWFCSLPDRLATTLIEQSKIKTLNDQQCLHQKHDLADGFHCVLSGRIRISNYSLEGKELVLTWMQPGNWFGEISLFDGLPRTHDAHAEGVTTLLKLSKSSFDEILKKNSQWYPYFMNLLCQRLRTTFMLIDETGCLSLKGQLCKRLLLMQQGLELQNNPQQNYELVVSQDTLAQLINSTRQTVNRILQELQANQVIKLKYGKLVILNTKQLEKLSQM